MILSTYTLFYPQYSIQYKAATCLLYVLHTAYSAFALATCTHRGFKLIMCIVAPVV